MAVSLSLPVAIRTTDQRPWARRTMCAMNNDGTAFCDRDTLLEQVLDLTWGDVPTARRCRRCDLLLGPA